MRNLFLAVILLCIAVAQGAAAASPAKVAVLPELPVLQTAMPANGVLSEPAKKCCMKQHMERSAAKSFCTADVSSLPPQLDLCFHTAADEHETSERSLSPSVRPGAPFRPPIV